MNAAPERHSGSSEASGPPTLETLPKSLLGAIARQIIAQEVSCRPETPSKVAAAAAADRPADARSQPRTPPLASTVQSPLFDRGDMLRLAATLALVGSRPTALMAHALFKHLSPRLGEPLREGAAIIASATEWLATHVRAPGLKLPCGMNEASNVRDMRELLKSWGVTHSGAAYGRKTDLWAAIQAQARRSSSRMPDALPAPNAAWLKALLANTGPAARAAPVAFRSKTRR